MKISERFMHKIHTFDTFSVFVASDYIIDISYHGKLLASYTNRSHEFNFPLFKTHVCENSQMPQKTRING